MTPHERHAFPCGRERGDLSAPSEPKPDLQARWIKCCCSQLTVPPVFRGLESVACNGNTIITSLSQLYLIESGTRRCKGAAPLPEDNAKNSALLQQSEIGSPFRIPYRHKSSQLVCFDRVETLSTKIHNLIAVMVLSPE